MFHDVHCNYDEINKTLSYRITELTHHGVHTSLKCARAASAMLFAGVHNNSCCFVALIIANNRGCGSGDSTERSKHAVTALR